MREENDQPATDFLLSRNGLYVAFTAALIGMTIINARDGGDAPISPDKAISVRLPDLAAETAPADEALCSTDSECMLLCPEDERNLPPDHPDYCDGGPQSPRPGITKAGR